MPVATRLRLYPSRHDKWKGRGGKARKTLSRSGAGIKTFQPASQRTSHNLFPREREKRGEGHSERRATEHKERRDLPVSPLCSSRSLLPPSFLSSFFSRPLFYIRSVASHKSHKRAGTYYTTPLRLLIRSLPRASFIFLPSNFRDARRDAAV